MTQNLAALTGPWPANGYGPLPDSALARRP